MRIGICKSALLALLMAAFAPLASASDRLEFEIERLDAHAYYARGRWNIAIRYKVEIENATYPSGYRLHLALHEDGLPIADNQGRPVVVDLGLRRISERDDHDITFEDVATIRLPRRYIRDPRDLKITGAVFRVR